MTLKRLEIKQFRNINNIEIVPSPAINVIFGENAEGKTNLIEAIWLIGGNKSFRSSKDTELVMFGKDESLIKAEFNSENRDQKAEIRIDKKRKATLNGVELKSVSELNKKFPVTVFSPDDLTIISDGPEARRNFADRIIASLYPKYKNLLSRYERAVTQRNQVLSDYKYHSEIICILEDFENEIAKYGNEIVLYRTRFCEKLNKYCPEIHSGISSSKEELTVSYQSSAGYSKEEFIKALKEARNNDCQNLSTSVGPHRDDFIILTNGNSARKFASQGQKRTAAIALKLSEAAVVEEMSGTVPIILLDDVMSELDKTRQSYILNRIKGKQVFITCCDPSNIEGLEAGKVFEIKNGETV